MPSMSISRPAARSTIKLVVLAALVILYLVASSMLVVQANENYDQETSITRRSHLTRRQASATASATSSSATSASSASRPDQASDVGAQSAPDEARPISRRPPSAIGRKPQVAAGPKRQEELDEEGGDFAEEARPASSSRRRVKQSRPRYKNYNEDEDEENCYGDEDGPTNYGGDDFANDMFHRPMNQFSRMMGSMFDQMQSMSRGNFANGAPRDGLGVAASASSSYGGPDDDGYSRTSSLISSNGRTRGLVSETRNGRTQTRRIGNWNNNDDRRQRADDQE